LGLLVLSIQHISLHALGNGDVSLSEEDIGD
jgi:hypothetical protein